MIGDGELYRNRRFTVRLITGLYVVFLVHGANAQPTGQPSPSSYGMSSQLDPSKAVIVAVLLCSFFFIGFLSIYIRHCSDPNSAASGRSVRRAAGWSRRGGLDDAIVESFPVFAYSAVKDIKIGSGTLECAVCLSEFEESETLRLLPGCSHVFHVDCIDAWLYSHATCPVCRAKLAPESDKLGEHDPARTESIAESSGPENTESRVPVDWVRDHVAIDVDDDRTGDSEAIDAALRLDGRRRSGIEGKFPRSNSTGHSLAQLGDRAERYTLRLPDDVRKRMITASGGGGLVRTRSYDAVLAAEGSTRRGGYRSGGEGSSRGRSYPLGVGGRSDRVSWTDRLGSFVSKMGAVRSPRTNGQGIGQLRGGSPLSCAVAR